MRLLLYKILPLFGFKKNNSRSIRVVLPDPDDPIIPTISPFLIVRLTFSNITVSLDTCEKSIFSNLKDSKVLANLSIFFLSTTPVTW